MEFINLTPHKIVYDDGINKREFEPSGEILRLEYSESASKYLDIDGLECVMRKTEPHVTIKCEDDLNVYFIESRDKELFYIVSNPVARYIKDRRFIAPDTSPEAVIRDEDGNIIAVKRFCRYE